MCRLLFIRSDAEFDVGEHLEKFSEIARSSKEYQGHGWGCAYWESGRWKIYKNLRPVWQDDLDQFGKSTQLLAHARSAFQDKDIALENNMPFYDGTYVFVFNGELRGVRIKESGRIGAEKIFNHIKRFDHGDMRKAIEKALTIIEKRSEYVRAMNLIIADPEKAYVASLFNEDPDYFTLRTRSNGALIVCSEPYAGEAGWMKMANRCVDVL